MRIVTEKAYVGWYAYDDDSYDGPESPIGHGHTEQEAIDDFMERIEESQ